MTFDQPGRFRGWSASQGGALHGTAMLASIFLYETNPGAGSWPQPSFL
ncbi:hypothetical protein ACFOHY_09910 [Rhizobium rosettiformans]